MRLHFNDPDTTDIYTLSLHDALPILIHDNLSYSSLEKLTELDKSFPTIKINIIKIPDNIQNQLNKISLEGNKLPVTRSEEHTSELQSRFDLVCRLLLEKKKKKKQNII